MAVGVTEPQSFYCPNLDVNHNRRLYKMINSSAFFVAWAEVLFSNIKNREITSVFLRYLGLMEVYIRLYCGGFPLLHERQDTWITVNTRFMDLTA